MLKQYVNIRGVKIIIVIGAALLVIGIVANFAALLAVYDIAGECSRQQCSEPSLQTQQTIIEWGLRAACVGMVVFVGGVVLLVALLAVQHKHTAAKS